MRRWNYRHEYEDSLYRAVEESAYVRLKREQNSIKIIISMFHTAIRN
ncbi:MAG: hypothetical protein IJS99_02185 [Synergistaceae bacterium]|nr:hypothetical protein [Synergistaceae bacterium]